MRDPHLTDQERRLRLPTTLCMQLQLTSQIGHVIKGIINPIVNRVRPHPRLYTIRAVALLIYVRTSSPLHLKNKIINKIFGEK